MVFLGGFFVAPVSGKAALTNSCVLPVEGRTVCVVIARDGVGLRVHLVATGVRSSQQRVLLFVPGGPGASLDDYPSLVLNTEMHASFSSVTHLLMVELRKASCTETSPSALVVSELLVRCRFEPGSAPLFSVDGAVSDIRDVLKSSKISPRIVLGHSWGYTVASRIAALIPGTEEVVFDAPSVPFGNHDYAVASTNVLRSRLRGAGLEVLGLQLSKLGKTNEIRSRFDLLMLAALDDSQLAERVRRLVTERRIDELEAMAAFATPVLPDESYAPYVCSTFVPQVTSQIELLGSYEKRVASGRVCKNLPRRPPQPTTRLRMPVTGFCSILDHRAPLRLCRKAIEEAGGKVIEQPGTRHGIAFETLG